MTAGQDVGSSAIRRIVVEFIPEEKQRYPTLGDWFYEGDTLQVRASGPTEDEAFLVALHEMVEVWLCRKAGVGQAGVDAFDLAFEAEREAGQHDPDDEPGDDPRAPYRKQHRFAMLIEHLTARELGLDDYGTVR